MQNNRYFFIHQTMIRIIHCMIQLIRLLIKLKIISKQQITQAIGLYSHYVVILNMIIKHINTVKVLKNVLLKRYNMQIMIML